MSGLDQEHPSTSDHDKAQQAIAFLKGEQTHHHETFTTKEALMISAGLITITLLAVGTGRLRQPLRIDPFSGPTPPDNLFEIKYNDEELATILGITCRPNEHPSIRITLPKKNDELEPNPVIELTRDQPGYTLPPRLTSANATGVCHDEIQNHNTLFKTQRIDTTIPRVEFNEQNRIDQ